MPVVSAQQRRCKDCNFLSGSKMILKLLAEFLCNPSEKDHGTEGFARSR